jgi:radical SAM/Cys-rich protein
MNAFLSALEASEIPQADASLKRAKLSTLQINLGNLCNQSCKHCHVEASPQGKKVMSPAVIDSILKFLMHNQDLVLDITGGAPELNSHFDYLIINARPLVKEIIVRSNLTVFFEGGKEYLPEFYKRHNIHLVCSLPCYKEENVDNQRGKGVFNKSIAALRLLNQLGFSRREGLCVDLVYNPTGIYLPPQQEELERDYKYSLKRDYGVDFNRLVTITNVPIKRFKEYLDLQGEYDTYLKLLKDNFNPSSVKKIMCREFLSVGYDGKLYDCDFNQSLGWSLKDKEGNLLTIANVDLEDLQEREIMVGEHCLSCTAGYGSSCQGALIDKKENVKTYYGRALKGTKDLKTNACCSVDSMPQNYQDILTKIHPEILNQFYGCGSPIPPLLENCTILDLGCGTGRDVYLTANLVGSRGKVIGVDMTDAQLTVAKRHLDYQMKKFGFSRPNVEFKKGDIENLKDLGIEDNSVDVVISNCVINLSVDKRSVFSEIFRVLKPGGELYFSDIFTGRRIPKTLQADPVLYGECLAGALYIEDFRRILQECGFFDYRVVSRRRLTLNSQEIELKVGMIDFYSMTVRTFKLDDLEDTCEDYGQVATYLGNIPCCPHKFLFDEHHIFISKKPMLVCGNTASMIQNTRYAQHFKVLGERTVHFGPFNCAPASEKMDTKDSYTDENCC